MLVLLCFQACVSHSCLHLTRQVKASMLLFSSSKHSRAPGTSACVLGWLKQGTHLQSMHSMLLRINRIQIPGKGGKFLKQALLQAQAPCQRLARPAWLTPVLPAPQLRQDLSPNLLKQLPRALRHQQRCQLRTVMPRLLHVNNIAELLCQTRRLQIGRIPQQQTVWFLQLPQLWTHPARPLLLLLLLLLCFSQLGRISVQLDCAIVLQSKPVQFKPLQSMAPDQCLGQARKLGGSCRTGVQLQSCHLRQPDYLK